MTLELRDPQAGEALRFAHPVLRNDDDVVLAAVKCFGPAGNVSKDAGGSTSGCLNLSIPTFLSTESLRGAPTARHAITPPTTPVEDHTQDPRSE